MSFGMVRRRRYFHASSRLTPGAERVLDANGIDCEGEEVLLRREIGANGKGRVFINNQPATVGVLRQLAPELALVHSQGETLGSFDQAQQRILLDRFGEIAARFCRRGLRDMEARLLKSWENWNPTSRIVCGWPICGAFRRKRSTRRH